MNHTPRNIGVSRHIGTYSDAVEVTRSPRWLYTAGTPGMHPDGHLPEGIEAQSRQAWDNVKAVLAKAGMGLEDIVKVNTTLTRADAIPAYAKVRAETMGELRPAFMLQIVEQLIKPELLVEIEVVAANA